MNSVKQAILAETSMGDCEVVSLLAGCYGHYDYMESSYGVTTARCKMVMEAVNALPAFIKEETGQVVTVQEVVSVMREAFEKIEALWDERVAGF